MHTQNQLLEVRGKMEPLSMNLNNLTKEINQVKKETSDLCCRESELQGERIKKDAHNSKGTICGCCGQKVQLYKRTLTPQMAICLMYMLKFYRLKISK